MASTDRTRPNLLFILSDDQGHWAMGCAGNPEVHTPNLDRLAASGTRFDHFFCASPVCSPARASLLTGRIPSQHGIHDWLRAGNTLDVRQEPEGHGQVTEYLAGIPGYTDVLAAKGYLCGLSGKWHLGDAHHPQNGFAWWQVHAKGGGPYYGAPMVQGDRVVEPPGYVTEVITDQALAFLQQEAVPSAATVYLGVHYTAPHSPWQREHHPAELWDAYERDCPFHSVPEGLAPPVWAERLGIPVKDARTRRAYLSGYFAAITAMDAGIGRLLDWLETHGLRENTLVFFTSDNGMSMGHHGLFGKGNASFPLNMFDTAVKVPAIMSRPRAIPSGCVCTDLLSHLDVFPTLLDYLGLAAPDAGRLPGHSFAPLLRGETLAAPESIVILDEYGPVRMIRTHEWKAIHRYPYGPHELYHLLEDPGETRNLAALPEYQQTYAGLLDQLEAWFLRTADPDRDGLRQGVTGNGQLGRVEPGTPRWPRFSGP